MTFYLDESGIRVKYMGMEYTPKTDCVSPSNAVSILYDIFVNLDTAVTENEEGNCFAKGKVNDRDYSVCFSPAGLPLYLSVDDIKLKTEFRNLTLVK